MKSVLCGGLNKTSGLFNFRNLKMEFNDPDKAVRLMKRAARFGHQLGGETRKETLSLSINNFTSVCNVFICMKCVHLYEMCFG